MFEVGCFDHRTTLAPPGPTGIRFVTGTASRIPMSQKQFRIRFNELGLALFCAVLMLASGFVTARLLRPPQTAALPAPPASTASDPAPKPPHAIPAWGELIISDINLAQPDEYIGYTLDSNNSEPHWTFTGQNRAEVSLVMQTCGLSSKLAARAVSDALSETNNGATIVHPDMSLLTSMSSDTRARLYASLAKMPGNPNMTYPYCFPRQTFTQSFGDGSRDTHALALLRSLLYPRGDGVCFSDIEFLMSRTPIQKERMEILRSLSRQSAVLVRIRIWPDTDINQLLAYWNGGVPAEELRPLLESITRVPDGGSISLLYLLPKFARDRLYTFPLPPQPGDAIMDCH